MSKLVVIENMSLDGVMQAPGRPDEDPRDGFQHGGWGLPYNDPVKGRIMAQGMSDAGPLLFGRRTYEDFYSVWPKRKDNPFTPVLDNASKYVASRTCTEPLPWKNSTLLRGEGTETVAALKSQPGKDIIVMGSGELVASLMRANLVDQYVLLIHPLILGSGRRLFPDPGTFGKLRLADAQPTPSGVVIATYHAA